MKIDLNISYSDPAAEAKLDHILALVQKVLEKENHMSQQLDDLTAEVEEVKGVQASAITLLQGLSAALAAAGTDPKKLQALRDDLKANTDALAAAVAANPVPGENLPPSQPFPPSPTVTSVPYKNMS